MTGKPNIIFLLLAGTILIPPLFSSEFEGFIPHWQTRLTENLFVYKPFEYSGCVLDSEYQRIFVTNRNGEIISLDSVTGGIEWRFSLKHPIHLKPVYSEGILFAASTGGEITALDVSKGKPHIIWQKEIPGGIISDITTSDQKIFILTERNTLYSISAKDGSVIYHIGNDLTEGFTVYTNTPVILLGERLIYTLSTGELYVVNKNDGKLIYKIGIYNPDDKIDGFTGLTADSESILLSTQSGLLYRIGTESGKIIWSRTLAQISAIKRDEESRDIFVFHNDGTIAVYDPDGKTTRKKVFLKKNLIGADISGGRIIVRYSDGKMLLLSKNDLSLISSVRLSSPVLAKITYDQRYAYVFSSKGSLIKFLIK